MNKKIQPFNEYLQDKYGVNWIFSNEQPNMKIEVLQAKIKKAIVTSANIDYKGSIILDPEFIERAGMREFQRVDINVKDNGKRFNTYILAGERGAGQVEINGAAAKMVEPGMTIHINAYGQIDMNETFDPIIVENVN